MAVDDIYTVALLHMDGADTSTTFTDESGKTWTAVGNAQIDTAQSVFGGASGLFDGTNDRITAIDTIDWQLDGGADANKWTIDFRVRFNGDPGTAIMGFIQQYVDDDNFWSIRLNNNTLNILIRSAAANIVNISNAWNPATATWYHVAVVKDGTNGYLMFVDGTQIGTTQTDVSTIPDFAAGVRIGRHTGGAVDSDFAGWLDEFRISKGIARWTTNFTPPTAAYAPATSGFFFMF
jgi:hypothetical protein